MGAGVEIGLAGFGNLIEKAINQPEKPLISRKKYELPENHINNKSKVLTNKFKPMIKFINDSNFLCTSCNRKYFRLNNILFG